MKRVDHTKEVLQQGLFNLDDVAYIEQDNDGSYVITLKANDERPESELHIFRSGCVIVPERNFHSMFIRIG
jgi:hypothetical protein